MDNPTEPVIIEGRPFTPDDLHHLDELNEEIQKQNPPKPYQWAPRITPQSTRELMYARFFGRPIILDTPTQVTDAPAADAVTPSNQKTVSDITAAADAPAADAAGRLTGKKN